MKKIFFVIALSIIIVINNFNKAIAQEDSKTNIKDAYTTYFELKNALVMTDANLAQKIADKLLTNISTVQFSKQDDNFMLWSDLKPEIIKNIQNIKESSNIEIQRKSFSKLSISVYKLIKVIKYGEVVYYQNCPMYNGSSNWLSLEKEIKNPYYGSRMLSCGSVKEIIK